MVFPRLFADPLALGVLGATILFASAARILEPWSTRAVWVLWWGLLVYALAIAAAHLLRRDATDPDLRAIHAIRRRILGQLSHYLTGGRRPGQEAVAQVRSQVRMSFDEEIMPAFGLLVEWKNDLRGELKRIQVGKSAPPSPEFAARVRALFEARESAVQEAVNIATRADAELYALLGELERGGPIDVLGGWKQALDRLQQCFVSPPSPGEAPQEPVPVELSASGPADSEATAPEDMTRIVSQALRDLNKTVRLQRSDLIQLLPRTLGAARGRWAPRNEHVPTPEEQAHALADVLNAAIDRLGPQDGSDLVRTRQDVHYKILHEEYRLGMSTAHIMLRLNVGDAQFFRWRHEAVSAVAADLLGREEHLVGGPVANPTAMDYLG